MHSPSIKHPSGSSVKKARLIYFLMIWGNYASDAHTTKRRENMPVHHVGLRPTQTCARRLWDLKMIAGVINSLLSGRVV